MSISSRVSVTEVHFLSLSVYCVYFALNRRGYPAGALSLSSFLVSSAGHTSRLRWGCLWEKPLIDNAPKKVSLFAQDIQQKAFDGMKCPVHHPLPHTSHYLRLLLLLLVYDPRTQPRRTEAFSCVSQWEQGYRRGRRGAVLGDCWQTSHRGPITFPGCQEGVNPEGGGGLNIGLSGNWLCN